MSGKAIRKIGSVFAALFLMLFTVISTIWGGKDSALVAFADGAPEYDGTNVLEDLEGGKIDGKAFALNDYPFDEDRDTAVLLFAEYCYSFYFDKQGNYGLYLYVYNPKGLVFDTESGRNTVTLAVGDTSEYGLRRAVLQVQSAADERGADGDFGQAEQLGAVLSRIGRGASGRGTDQSGGYSRQCGIPLQGLCGGVWSDVRQRGKHFDVHETRGRSVYGGRRRDPADVLSPGGQQREKQLYAGHAAIGVFRGAGQVF